MSVPVWVLSVDLQTKTATFTTGLADAARSARSSFQDIKNASTDMGAGVAQSGQNVRAAVGLIDNTIRGAHAMAMADLVREFSQTRIVMAALPFAATVAGFVAVAGIIVEAALKIKEMREEHEKLKEVETQFGTAVNQSFNSLDEKLIQAEKRSDELRQDHLGALNKELQLIDKQSMGDLIKELDLIAKASDEVFKHLEGHWYTLGIGSAGASHALDQFKTKYESLLSQGRDKEASDLLGGTLKSAQDVLKYQEQALANQGKRTATGTTGDYSKVLQAEAELKKAGVGYSEKEVEAQRQIVTALQDQFTAQQKIAAIAGKEGDNAKRQTGNEASARKSEADKQAVASQLAMAEQVIAGDRATAAARLEIAHASVQQRLQTDLDFAQRDADVKLAANQAEQAALDKSGKDYTNQLQNLRNKALEIEQAHSTQVAELTARASVEQAKRDIANLEAGEREKIQATQEGSAARLAAIDAATRTAEAAGLQETDFYRTLGTERVAVARQMADQEAKIKADAGREAAQNSQKLAELQLAADLEKQAVADSARRVTTARRIAEELAAENQSFSIKQDALQKEQTALDTGGKDYENKLQALQNKELQLIQEHENRVTQIKDQAQIDRNQKILAAASQYEATIAAGLTKAIMGQESFAAAMRSVGNQVVSDMIQFEIKHIEANMMSKQSDAAAAARKGFNIGLSMGGPAGLILGPLFGAAMYAEVMAFAKGGVVPGVGNTDSVPAFLTPGEGIVPGSVMGKLAEMASSGAMDASHPEHVASRAADLARQRGGTGDVVHHHHYTTNVKPTYHLQALDSSGMAKILDKHSDDLQKHFEKTLRRMNR